ncbi:hypothetical protein NEHOM01_0912 [Nematocida homosporus]|uniref:uncharacterized protein n=1 Tax=Nematocida homosporus TaxID=1912981 RepID=UPI0022202EE5|nr:uncharacterized protein NEHOM01_0912 [Nematocida homosporus]KAI5185553.1 hypothetical protein NEHOM01_0912 [Nematocida homosporus]
MPLSLSMNKPTKTHLISHRSTSISNQLCVRQAVQSIKHIIMLAPSTASASTNRSDHFKEIKPGNVARLCLLLLIVSSIYVSGISTNISLVAAQNELPSSDAMILMMESMGFEFKSVGRALIVKSYHPNEPEKVGGADNSLPTQCSLAAWETPIYVVEYPTQYLTFHLPAYIHIHKARLVLFELRKIAFIKTSHATINYAHSNPGITSINLQILSRVVNMLDCMVLELCLDPRHHEEIAKSPEDLKKIQIEARDTVKHASYTLKCRLQFTNIQSKEQHTELLRHGIIIQRPISSVYLDDNQIDAISLLQHVSLINGYEFSFEWTHSTSDIDLNLLQTLPVKCKQLFIIGHPDRPGISTIDGLENAIIKHPKMSLKASWATIQYLCVHNKSLIHVHTIEGILVSHLSNQTGRQPSQNPVSSDFRISASLGIITIDNNLPCQSTDYYKLMYKQEDFTKLGISFEQIQFDYQEDRVDLYATLEAFYGIKALDTMPTEVLTRAVICCGDKLSDPNWMLQETLNIWLNKIQIDDNRQSYICFATRDCSSRWHMHFCRCIHYTCIRISGGNDSDEKKPVKKCILLLTVLQSLTAKELKISNIRNDKQIETQFNISVLKSKIAKSTKWHLNVKFLILDNVDQQIIYWMLGHYTFTNPIEIYLLNQHFSNLAIAEVLSLPQTEQIALLEINNILGLNEVINFQQKTNQTNGFSIFRYIKAAMKQHNPSGSLDTFSSLSSLDTFNALNTLNLHKLSLQLGCLNFSLYTKLIQKLASYNIQLSAMPLEDYIKGAASNPIANLAVHKRLFTLYNITLAALEAGLKAHQTPTRTQHRPLPTLLRQSVEELRLEFSRRQSLNEPDLITIIRWVACLFKDLVALRLANVRLTCRATFALRSHKYWVYGLCTLANIYIEIDLFSQKHVRLPIQLYSHAMVSNVFNYRPELTAISSATLLRFIAFIDQIDKFVSNHAFPKASLKMIVNSIKENKTDFECPVCFRVLGMVPSERGWKNISCFLTSSPTHNLYNSSDNFAALCYLKCGHRICNECIPKMKKMPSTQCPTCRTPNVYDNPHRLIGIPLSRFIFAEDSVKTLHPNPDQLNAYTWDNEQIYFYIPYSQIDNLLRGLDKNPNHDVPKEVSVI